MGPETVICTFRVRPGVEHEFETLLFEHWRLLARLGHVGGSAPQYFVGVDPSAPTFVEIFEWPEGEAEKASRVPEVAALWNAMRERCEPRDGRPALEFPHFLPLHPPDGVMA